MDQETFERRLLTLAIDCIYEGHVEAAHTIVNSAFERGYVDWETENRWHIEIDDIVMED